MDVGWVGFTALDLLCLFLPVHTDFYCKRISVVGAHIASTMQKRKKKKKKKTLACFEMQNILEEKRSKEIFASNFLS